MTDGRGDSPVTIFVGPSATGLDLEPRSHRIDMQPPIKRFDLERLASGSSRPGTAVIVDGIFHSTQSVSLTEIRQALQAGWNVVGLSSMGALRAVEAAPIGMIGFGAVFRWLKLFQVEDDDEVGQAVDPDSGLALSDAMVDIRYFFIQARRAQLITADIGRKVLGDIKRLYFPERSIARALNNEALKGLNDRTQSDLKRLAENFVGIKQKDFIEFWSFQTKARVPHYAKD